MTSQERTTLAAFPTERVDDVDAKRPGIQSIESGPGDSGHNRLANGAFVCSHSSTAGSYSSGARWRSRQYSSPTFSTPPRARRSPNAPESRGPSSNVQVSISSSTARRALSWDSRSGQLERRARPLSVIVAGLSGRLLTPASKYPTVPRTTMHPTPDELLYGCARIDKIRTNLFHVPSSSPPRAAMHPERMGDTYSTSPGVSPI